MTEHNNTPGRESRHISLSQIGISGQQLIADSKAIIIGMGGIGCIAASYLASSGIGELFICDFDSVDKTNLGRQILYGPDDIGKSKVECGKEHLLRINPKVKIQSIEKKINQNELLNIRELHEAVILDCTDNFNSRFEINQYAVKHNRYLVSGSAIRFEGQIAVFGNNYIDSPCYECLYSQLDESLEDCSGSGVLSPIPGMIGSMMAIEAIKIITGIKINNTKLSLYDGISSEWTSIAIKKQEQCPTCGL
ncbi:MAG: HesA/MoeB/ThiF family protein [Pseudomonadota bacterium]|nr:HesA/MoeB/ThiF family protein [Pseudomonadota bacterium]